VAHPRTDLTDLPQGETATAGPGARSRAPGEAFDSLEPRSEIDYAFRTIQQSQVHFSAMADSKANIMITVCSIVISASLTQLHRPESLRLLLTLDFFTAISLVAALLCVMPSRRNPSMKDGRVDATAPGFNPLFFMHFRHLPLEDFQRRLEHEVSTPGRLYRALAQDIHASGQVLAESKFRYLRASYGAFILGLAAALIVLVRDVVMR